MGWRANRVQWELEGRLARGMRLHPTQAERLLWDQLRRQHLRGLRFRRQHIIGRFIVDFYCAERRLILEVDGPIHAARIERDGARSAALRALGFTVLRFTNADVLLDIRRVIDRITEFIDEAPV